MKVVNKSAIDEFVKKHADSKASFNYWLTVVESANWKKSTDLKSTFNSANYKKGTWLFNVGGNDYRLSATIKFDTSVVYIDKVMTHGEYSKKKW